VLIQSRNELQSLLMILRIGGDGEGPLGVGLVVSLEVLPMELASIWVAYMQVALKVKRFSAR